MRLNGWQWIGWRQGADGGLRRRDDGVSQQPISKPVCVCAGPLAVHPLLLKTYACTLYMCRLTMRRGSRGKKGGNPTKSKGDSTSDNEESRTRPDRRPTSPDTDRQPQPSSVSSHHWDKDAG